MSGDDTGVLVRVAVSPGDIASVRALFQEYAASLDYDTCFEGFEQEVEEFPGAYARPGGLLLVAHLGAQAVGAIGLLPAGPGRAEMKRLYVRPTARGCGFGRQLVVMLLEHARRLGYHRVELESLPRMKAARALYCDLGFQRTDEGNDSEIQRMVLDLSPGRRGGRGPFSATNGSELP